MSFVDCRVRSRQLKGAHFFDYVLSGLSYRRTPEKLVRAVVLVDILIYGGFYLIGVDIVEPIYVESFVYFHAMLIILIFIILEAEALADR